MCLQATTERHGQAQRPTGLGGTPAATGFLFGLNGRGYGQVQRDASLGSSGKENLANWASLICCEPGQKTKPSKRIALLASQAELHPPVRKDEQKSIINSKSTKE